MVKLVIKLKLMIFVLLRRKFIRTTGQITTEACYFILTIKKDDIAENKGDAYVFILKNNIPLL